MVANDVSTKIDRSGLIFLQNITRPTQCHPEDPSCHLWVTSLQRLAHNLPWRDAAQFFQDDSLASLTQRCVLGKEAIVAQVTAHLFDLVLLALKVDECVLP